MRVFHNNQGDELPFQGVIVLSNYSVLLIIIGYCRGFICQYGLKAQLILAGCIASSWYECFYSALKVQLNSVHYIWRQSI